MIVSVSRRTDIPAFYSSWFMNRIRAGYCVVPNPFNPKQASHVSLTSDKVDLIVFWTRNAHPLLPYLSELEERGYPYYFLYTLMANPTLIDPGAPSLDVSLQNFCELSHRIGPDRVIWRYDPILFTNRSNAEFHGEKFSQIASTLRGYTRRTVLSLVHPYRKVKRRLNALAERGVELEECHGEPLGALMRSISSAARENGMELQSCAEETDLTPFDIRPGKCIDDKYIEKVFGLKLRTKKDPSQRKACGCLVSKDIGMYDSCLFGCAYCYATNSPDRARRNHDNHDEMSPSLLGWYGKKS